MIARRLAPLLVIAACAAPAAAPAPRVIANHGGAVPDDPFAPRPLEGPYRSIDDWCQDRARRGGACGDAAHRTSGGTTRIDGAALVADGDDTCALVVRVGDRVWADEGAMPCLPAAGAPTTYRSIVIEQLAWQDLIDGAPHLLVLRVASAHDTAGMSALQERSMIVCGSGASGAPRCTPWIPIESEGAVVQVAYHPAIARDGTLTFRVDDREDTVDPDWIDVLSHPHPLRFP